IITPPSLVTAPSTPVRLANAMPAARLPAFEPGKAGGVSPVRKRGSRARIGELLVAEGVISQDQLHEALREHRRSKERLGSVLARRGLVTEERLVEVLSKEHGLPSVDVRQQPVPAEILALVPGHLARKYEVLPLSRVDGALRRGASDLHWEPYEKVFRIRFRIDGVMHEMVSPPKKVEAAVISRLKIMANLDISERRLPQDGRIKLRHGSREIDFRVSILPTIFGEKAVLRILDKESLQLDLTKLGFDPWSFEKFTDAIHQPYGMVLITGPTGSGKTT